MGDDRNYKTEYTDQTDFIRSDRMEEHDLKYEYWLASLYRIPDNRRRQAGLICGSAAKLYGFSEKEMRELHYFTESEINYICESRRTFDPEKEWERLQREKIRFLPCCHEEYPERLRRIYDPPFALYVKGSLPDKEKKSVAVVGARACSEYGRGVARLLGRTLAEHEVPVFSGLAVGIDSASHAGALMSDGSRFAVLGSGCDVCYPRSSENLYRNMISGKGGILSELRPGTQPLPQFFPRRNRIISALADVVVVVEAKKRSGSLITADCAIEQGKDVYAVPGRFRESLSEGCNHLIEQGAGILYDIENFLKNTGIVSDSEIMKKKLDKLSLEKEERLVYISLDFNPKFIDIIIEETGLNLLTVLHALDALKKKQLVQETFQNYFCKKL